jgi:glycosyltransferase involved in cell wall biosynthesis
MKKRILAIAATPFFIVKGSSLRVKSSMKMLSKEYRVDLLTYPIGQNPKIKGLNIIRIPGPFSRALGVSKVSLYRIFLDFTLLIHTIIQLARTPDYVAIHCEDFEAALIGSLCKLFWSSKKLVYNLHNSVIDNLMINNIGGLAVTLTKPIEALVLKSCDLIIINWKQYRNYRSIPDKPNFLFYDSVETREQSIGLTLPKRFIVYAGNYEKYQGIKEFITTYAKNRIKTRLILVGDISREISETLRKLKLENKVIVIGKLPIEQTNYILKRSLMALSPRTRGDQPGLKTIHHLLIGKITLGTYSIPNLEILKNSVNAILYRNERELGDILRKLDSNKIDLGQLNKEVERSRASLRRMLSEKYYLSNYKKVFNE